MLGSVLSILAALFPWIFPSSLLIRCYFYFHFTDEETEGLRISLKFLELISGRAEIWTQGFHKMSLASLTAKLYYTILNFPLHSLPVWRTVDHEQFGNVYWLVFSCYRYDVKLVFCLSLLTHYSSISIELTISTYLFAVKLRV